jgi:hypothetical protein
MATGSISTATPTPQRWRAGRNATSTRIGSHCVAASNLPWNALTASLESKTSLVRALYWKSTNCLTRIVASTVAAMRRTWRFARMAPSSFLWRSTRFPGSGFTSTPAQTQGAETANTARMAAATRSRLGVPTDSAKNPVMPPPREAPREPPAMTMG